MRRGNTAKSSPVVSLTCRERPCSTRCFTCASMRMACEGFCSVNLEALRFRARTSCCRQTIRGRARLLSSWGCLISPDIRLEHYLHRHRHTRNAHAAHAGTSDSSDARSPCGHYRRQLSVPGRQGPGGQVPKCPSLYALPRVPIEVEDVGTLVIDMAYGSLLRAGRRQGLGRDVESRRSPGHLRIWTEDQRGRLETAQRCPTSTLNNWPMRHSTDILRD